MIKVKYDLDDLTMDITGHAGHGKPGEDIVCASVSALFNCLVSSCLVYDEFLADKPDIRYKTGDSHFHVVPKTRYAPTFTFLFVCVLNTLRILAEEYPENVFIVG